MDSNKKGAIASDAQQKGSSLILGAKNQRVNLIRQIRRRLKKRGHTIYKIKGEYRIVDMDAYLIVDIERCAAELGIPLCGICKSAAARTVTDSVLLCRDCNAELNRRAVA